ncbi:Bardet-Biedl syndrome 4 protein homolog [Anopheles moucheti]|uniref:Bardet-Biedl syndrome 4 protein homolog n=1 Tax=Anopheles moucheti TaxID=186751 RepID=UPI0022F0C032|nr:Bardet-Biedl syndrome 4 protein homolog [Anopheles moucheti]
MTERYVYCNGRANEAASSLGANKQQAAEHTMKPQTVTNRHMNWLIHGLYTRKHFEQCKKLIDRQLTICYDKQYLHYMKGLILREENNPTEAVHCFQQAIALKQNEPENYKELAKTLYSMGKFRNALEVFLKAETLLERPDHEIYHHIGELYYKNFGQPKAGVGEAKEYLKQAITCGKHVESYKILAEIYIEEGDSIKAIEMIENCLQITQEDVSLMTQIGILYLKINEYQRAFEKLLDATAADSKHTSALVALGSILQSKNDIDGALNKYKRIPNLPEESAEVWSNIGLCFFKKQKFIAAISCLKKAVWISPLNFNALYNLGLVFVTAQQYVSAFQTLAAAISLRPDHAECYMLLGTCLRHLNDPGNAYLSLEKSTMLPDAVKNPLIYLNFALYCYETGKSDQSVLYLSNFLDMTQHITVHREYLKMADRLNGALTVAASGQIYAPAVPESGHTGGLDRHTEKDDRMQDETVVRRVGDDTAADGREATNEDDRSDDDLP